MEETVKLSFQKRTIEDLKANPHIFVLGDTTPFLLADIAHKIITANQLEECLLFAPTEQLLSCFVEKGIPVKRVETVSEEVFSSVKRFIVFNEYPAGPEMRMLLLNARHHNTGYLLSVPYSSELSPELRSNADYLFFEHAPDEQKPKIYEDYAMDYIPSYTFFDNLLTEVSSDGSQLVINTCRRKDDLYKMVNWYKADD